MTTEIEWADRIFTGPSLWPEFARIAAEEMTHELRVASVLTFLTKVRSAGSIGAAAAASFELFAESVASEPILSDRVIFWLRIDNSWRPDSRLRTGNESLWNLTEFDINKSLQHGEGYRRVLRRPGDGTLRNLSKHRRIGIRRIEPSGIVGIVDYLGENSFLVLVESSNERASAAILMDIWEQNLVWRGWEGRIKFMCECLRHSIFVVRKFGSHDDPEVSVDLFLTGLEKKDFSVFRAF